MNRYFIYLFYFICFLLYGCFNQESRHTLSLLNNAEQLLQTDADSASRLLAALPHPDRLNDRNFARWCMLCGRSTQYTHADSLFVNLWKRAQRWIDKHGSPEERAQAGLFLGRAYAEDKEWDLAMKTYAEALHYAKEHGIYNVAGYICTYMADLYQLENMPAEINMKYAEAASLFSQAGNHKSQVYAMKNLAMELAFIDSFLQAKHIMKEVDAIASTLNDPRVNYHIANAYANIYDLQERYDLAEEYYQKAISLDTCHELSDSMGLARMYIISGKIKQAKEIVDRMASHTPTAYGVNILYGDIYKAMGDYEKALHFKELCFDIVDSLSNAQSKAQILEIEKKYNHLKIREENSRLKNARQRFLIYLIICTSLLIIGSLIFIFYRRHAKMQLDWQEEKLNSLDRERSEIAEQLSEARHSLGTMQENQNENLKLQQEIIFLTKKYKQLQKQRLESSTIYKKLLSLSTQKQPGNDKSLLTDKYWSTLTTELCKIYPDFQRSLLAQYPNLSEEEWRYCCLHVLGFDGNSEAVLLGIMPASVWMKRSRIKQKLNPDFPKDQTLHDILTDNFLN